jgi:hypothetical protein
MATNATTNLPLLFIRVLQGDVAPYKEFIYVISGELARNWTETYNTEFEHERNEGSLAPHHPRYQYKFGNFQPYDFTIPLFSGRDSARGILDTGLQIKQEAEALANLAKPNYANGQFSSPAFCYIRLANFWSAKGFFVSSSLKSHNVFDASGLPLVVDVSLTFERHFGTKTTRATTVGGLQKATSTGYRLLG